MPILVALDQQPFKLARSHAVPFVPSGARAETTASSPNTRI